MHEVVIVGAGPAGLSAAAELGGRGLLVDEGKPAGERDRQAPRDLLSGVGGAGLFSDGKHSFYPSATALWRLPDREALEAAFAATAELLARHGVAAGEMPPAGGAPEPLVEGAWQPKTYPSIYVALEERRRMIDELWRGQAGVRVADARREGRSIVLVTERGDELRAERVIVAGGRWSPRFARPWLEKLGARFSFRRVELGVRLELPATSELFARLPGVDGKLRLAEGGVEMRTFCTCRNGEVLLGEAGDLRAFSGRADGPPTGRSNVGLVVRSADAGLGREVMAALAAATPESVPLTAWDGRMFGARCGALVRHAVERLDAFSPLDGAVVHGPIIEGVGDYPDDDGGLQIADGVWVAGDACGRFRGIVAAMVSGRYVARAVMRSLRGARHGSEASGP